MEVQSSDYLGKGVLKAVDNVNSIIAPALIEKLGTNANTQFTNFVVVTCTAHCDPCCKQDLGAARPGQHSM
ncbi:enolase [Tanacetum coccineum]